MCGITGIINLNGNRSFDRELITAMTETLVHRGPDDSGIYIDDRVALGHRRLTIIDLSSSGRQPMFDVKNNVGIVFNGEVYNYLEIKSDLLDKGYEFKSDTDTEVVINAYLEYGIDCLERFTGMFAFCLYDKRDGRFFLVRDRIGIKPLYYTLYDNRLIFGSEIKAILKYPGFKASPDLLGVSSYLSYRYPVRDRSMFEYIKSLLPGNYLEIVGDKISRKEYWNLPVIARRSDRGEDFYAEKVREILDDAIRLRMRSDVPLGAYLSGGLDSSMIVALMSKYTPEPVKSFTIGFREEGYNEFEYARQVADMYQTDHHEILLESGNYIEEMKRLIRFKDSPLGVANEPALHVMSKELKKYITVVLSGEGADEIFGGYGRIFRSPYDYMRLKELEKNNDLSSESVYRLMKENLTAKYGDSRFESPLEHFIFLYGYTSWRDKLDFLHPDTLAELDNDNQLTALFSEQFDKVRELDIYDQYLWIFEKMHIVGLLHRADMTTMATSVEARVPFVDHRLVEFALSIPVNYKLKWKSAADEKEAAGYNSDQISEKYDIPKYILKKSIGDDLPHSVVYRKKMGFPVPVHSWLGGDFNGFAREILLDRRAGDRGLYNQKHLEKYLGDHSLFKEHRFGLKIWMLVNLELWYRDYIDK